MTEENRRTNIAREMNRAADALASAVLLLEGGFYFDAVSRAYYHALHSARALILSSGLESKSHSGVSHLVSQHFVQSGKMNPLTARTLSSLEADRLDADYDAAAVFTREIAQDAIQKARAYGEAVRAILAAEGYL